jgi:two-component system, OmpR family, alkaline phosphatase synthesis response regulator PhoP
MAQRILIVDDEPSIVVPLEFLLKREGYEVAVAEDGRAALDALDRRAPDLVILDVMLPKMSGFDVCRHIRADPRWPGLKILMLTAKGRDSEMQRGLELGADAYVTKPFSTRELVARIRALLGSAP